MSSESGAFTFQRVDPAGAYTVKPAMPDSSHSSAPGIVVTGNERASSLGNVQLQVGAVTETVMVRADAAHVETDSAESSADISTTQLANLTARGREVVSLLRTIPGVSYQADQDSAGGTYGTSTPSIRGASANMNILSVDGVVSNDQGSPNVFSSVTTMDAIGEVKVILNAYQAEYAGNGGTVVQVVSKSGGSEFHGTAYWYVRNNDFNANDFFNNRNNVKRPEYRYNTEGFSLGGPIYIPGHWNRSKSKLFGFYNLEQLESRIPGALTQYSMPTALERQGDFSQSFGTNGKVIPVNDPYQRQGAVSRERHSHEPPRPERPDPAEDSSPAEFRQSDDHRV